MDPDGAGSPGQRAPVDGPAAVEVTGVVIETMPSALYRVRLDGGTRQIVAHIADRMDRNFVRLLVGDRVSVELSHADLTRGRIVQKLSV